MRKTKIISIMLIMTMFVSVIDAKIYASNQTKIDKEIVFVLDRSGSMISKDKNNMANELVKMYIDTLDSEHTEVGIVGFNDTIVTSIELTKLDSIENRTNLKNTVNKIPIKGDTDIGLALKQAVNLFDQTDDSEKIIVLLSDGETDVKSSKVRTEEQSINDENFAIDKAIKNGYKIFTIGINVNDSSYLNKISSKTNGKTYSLNNVSDLYKVFVNLSSDGVNKNIKALDDITINGIAENISVKIPNEYIKENSIIMIYNKPLNNIKVTNFDLYKSNYYSSLKLKNNIVDKIDFKMISDGSTEIHMFYNLISSLEPILETPQKVSDTEYVLTVKVFDSNTNEQVDKEYYKNLEGTVFINTNDAIKEFKLLETSNGFETTIEVNPENQNDTQIYISIKNDESVSYSENINLSLANNVPTIKDNSITKILLSENQKEINLNQYFSDKDGDVLSYELISINGDYVDNVNIIDNKLTLNATKEGLENIEILAHDGNGGYRKGILSLSVMPFWIYFKDTSIIIGVMLILLLLVGIALVRKKEKNKHIATKEDEGDKYISESKNFFRDGKLEGYFLSTKSGKEYPAMFWNENYLANKTLITLGELLSLMEITENLMEARKIYFEATDKDEITFWHRTKCTVYVNNKLIESGKRVSLKYEDKMYIIFEDGETEIEVRYKRTKKKSLA